MKEIGIIGFGAFGQFMAGHLRRHFRIFVYDAKDTKSLAKKAKVRPATLAEAAGKDIVIIAVPVQSFEGVIKKVSRHVRKGALVLDVCSVKVNPAKLMVKYLPKNVEIVATHPLFGPQSGKDGIAGLTIVVCPLRTSRLNELRKFLTKKLGLNVLLRTPEAHDKEMAYVQALTHLIGWAINELDIPDLEQKTVAYQKLLDIKRMLGEDSGELFLAIQKENPYAERVRKRFIEIIKGIEHQLR